MSKGHLIVSFAVDPHAALKDFTSGTSVAIDVRGACGRASSSPAEAITARAVRKSRAVATGTSRQLHRRRAASPIGNRGAAGLAVRTALKIYRAGHCTAPPEVAPEKLLRPSA